MGKPEFRPQIARIGADRESGGNPSIRKRNSASPSLVQISHCEKFDMSLVCNEFENSALRREALRAFSNRRPYPISVSATGSAGFRASGFTVLSGTVFRMPLGNGI